MHFGHAVYDVYRTRKRSLGCSYMYESEVQGSECQKQGTYPLVGGIWSHSDRGGLDSEGEETLLKGQTEEEESTLKGEKAQPESYEEHQERTEFHQ